MNNLTTSRFITYPDIIHSTTNHIIALIDADINDIENIELFCKISKNDYDIYLYHQDLDKVDWLTEISNLADYILINETSLVKLDHSDNISKFGSSQKLTAPLTYFQNIDNTAINL